MATLRSLLAAIHAAPADAPPDNTATLRALVNEIWMLVDFVAGSSTQGLDKAVVANPAHPDRRLTPMELLHGVSNIEAQLDANMPDVSHRAFLQVVRDALNCLIAPATGLTVAYSSMVAGPMRARSASRFALAQQAYSNLRRHAGHHRTLSLLLLLAAMFCTGLAVWESAKVALGKTLLQNMDLLHTEQAALNGEKNKLEISLTGEASAARVVDDLANKPKHSVRMDEVPLASYRVCDRAAVRQARLLHQDLGTYLQNAETNPKPRIMAYASAEERDVCGRDDVLHSNLDIMHNELVEYGENWPAIVGSVFQLGRKVLVWFGANFPDALSASPDDKGAMKDSDAELRKKDVEFRTAPVLLVWGNFVLPVVFGLIGSAIFVMLDNYKKLLASRLHPRDTFLMPVRLAMGMVVGACVGLFYSASGPPPGTLTAAPASLLVSSLTLTASGVAFLAGFGVETVFTLLQSLIDRMFVTDAAK